MTDEQKTSVRPPPAGRSPAAPDLPPLPADRSILFTVADGVARLTFNRPASRNALTFAMYDALELIVAWLARNDDPAEGRVKVLVLAGAGDQAFAAGTDIAEFRQLHSADDALAYERRIDRLIGGLAALPFPVVAALQGACTGGGAAIAAACDIRLAAPGLRFGFPIARTLGNCLSTANLCRLVRLLGEPLTRDILFTSRLIDADEALRIALVSEVSDALDDTVERCLQRLLTQAPLTLRATKAGLARLHDSRVVAADDLVARCYTSEDFAEGIEAFLSKRVPEWRGR